MTEEKTYNYCLRCGRKLKSEDSKKIGYGIICATKQMYSKKVKKLFIKNT